MSYYAFFKLLHVAFGCVALVTFWVTAALRKGTPLHRRVGGSYLVSMSGILATTPALAYGAFATGRTLTGAFLLYLIVITGTAVWAAWRAIRDRRTPERFFGRSYRALALLNLATGAAVLMLGALEHAPILAGMSLLGLAAGARMLHLARHPPTDRQWWLQRHYLAIVGCGIATHIAFLNIGLQRLLPDGQAALASYVGWFGPIAGAIVASWWLRRKYAGGLVRA